MGASLRIAKVAGIDIKVHVTFLLVLVFGAYQWREFGARGAVFGAVLFVLIFACVALHELGHSLVAKAFGVPVKDITLYPIGGIAQMGKRPETPMQELLIAIAGPMVNVVIAGALGVVTWLQYGEVLAAGSATTLALRAPSMLTLQVMLVASNLMLALFNLVPAFPMDGGRVLRAVLSMLMPEVKATRIAVTVGRMLAVGMVVLGLTQPGFVMLPVVAMFIFMSGGMELRETRLMRALAAIRAGDAVNPYVPRFTPATTVGEAMQALVFVPHQAFAVEHFGRLVGVVTRRALMEAANEQGPFAYVAGVMERTVPSIRPGETLDVARVKMSEAGAPWVAVVEGELFLGLVTEHELVQHLAMYESLQRPEAKVVRPGTEGRL